MTLKAPVPTPAGASATPAAHVPERPDSGGVSEAAIDAYLAAYGKPPREAVRALLNPTDENIAAMAAAEKRRGIIADYVAQHWAALIEAHGARQDRPALAAQTVLPQFIGIELIVYVVPDCERCNLALGRVNALIEENPVAQARVVVIAEDPHAALATALAAGVSMSVETWGIDRAREHGIHRLPWIEIVDRRTQRHRGLAGVPPVSVLRDAVLELRGASAATTPAHE